MQYTIALALCKFVVRAASYIGLAACTQERLEDIQLDAKRHLFAASTASRPTIAMALAQNTPDDYFVAALCTSDGWLLGPWSEKFVPADARPQVLAAGLHKSIFDTPKLHFGRQVIPKEFGGKWQVRFWFLRVRRTLWEKSGEAEDEEVCVTQLKADRKYAVARDNGILNENPEPIAFSDHGFLDGGEES